MQLDEVRELEEEREFGSLAEVAAMAPSFWCLLMSASLFLVSADGKSNPAGDLVVVLNKNRTAHKLASLADNPGLGCIALQYIKAYKGRCKDVGPNGKKPAEADFTETFAPNCGVQPSTLAPITGRLLGCQTRYVHPPEAFSGILAPSNRSLEILDNKNNTQVGAAVVGTDGGSPYFWCVLFASGRANETFVLDAGVAKPQRPGCFSGTDDDCSGADGSRKHRVWPSALGILILAAYAF